MRYEMTQVSDCKPQIKKIYWKKTNKQTKRPRLNSLTTTYTYPQQIGFVPLSKLL